ncbi:MAG: PD40 domain-containing protein, partial [Calditrichaeota bacterium]|nr:PD40 domain-containing protein [Calditrichota bacterium]
TSHVGYEMFARFSPDGSQLAFTAQYDGNTEVYVMPSEGGEPVRLSYTATLQRDDIGDRMGPNNIVMGWTPDGQNIIFRSRKKSFNPFIGQLFLISPEGGLEKQVPLPEGGFCSYSPDGQKLAYNRIFREFRTWKKYRGGMADDIWIHDFTAGETRNITNNPSQDIIPMWHENQIYFISDRDENKRMNLYVYNLDNQETRQLTRFTDYDIKFPSTGKKAIVFENAGWIYRYDFQTGEAQKVDITIANDLVYGRDEMKKVSANINNYEISPDGNRALFGARGEVFTVPAKEGPTRNLTESPGVHDRNSKWSPDGKWISFISDKTGEDEIYIIRQDGNANPVQITSNAETYKYQPYWSPDSKKLLWSDRLQRLRYVDIESKETKEVTQSKVWEIRDYSWSPDSKWIAYSESRENGMNVVNLYSLESEQVYPVTEQWTNSFGPSFSPDGKYLFFISERDFNPVYSETEWNHAYTDMQRIYLATLARGIKSPFEPKSDEVKVVKKDDKKEEKKDSEKAVTVQVDPEGLSMRVVGLPVQPSEYRNITAVENAIYYIRKGTKDEKPLLFRFDLKEKKETELGEIDGYEISADHKKMLVGQQKTYAIIDLPKAKVEMKDKLDLSGMEVTVDRQKEWQQIFEESWRQMREFFYAPNMHGLDWRAIKQKYQALVPYVNHRSDLTYIIGEMISELNVGHAYVGGGDTPDADRIKTGLLGAEIEKDIASGYYKIRKILQGENWNKNLRSPLTEIGVDVKEGDFILAMDGEPTNQLINFYTPLLGKVGKQVKLKVNSEPAEKGSREVTVVPISDESDLYYHGWVQENIRKVDKATNGKVGYVHIPDMGVRGLNTFVKYFYPQLRKKAIIVDVRGNGGGNVSPMIIERLHREIQMMEKARNTIVYKDPGAMIWGPKVCLMDEYSASDGDLFPYRFKKLGLGPLIGKRTWGGVVGIRGSLPLIDGGSLNKPEFASFNVEGTEWIIEGYGVEPDIFVDNDPAKEYQGIDQQLNKAIEVILEKLETEEKTIPEPPPYPDKR